MQTEKVARRNLTELVLANGRIQPVLQVKISPEVSGEIIDLPVKEGQKVNKGDLLVKIKPDFYIASRQPGRGQLQVRAGGQDHGRGQLAQGRSGVQTQPGPVPEQARLGFARSTKCKAAYDVAKAQLESATHQVEVGQGRGWTAPEDRWTRRPSCRRSTGTISKLNSQLGERVLGTVQNVGTEIMTIADLNEMEARVDIGENDVVLIAPGQKARLEVDAFKNRKFTGTVTEIANSSKDAGQMGMGSSQEATKFEVRIRIQEKEAFRPGMSVTAEIETRYRTNVLTVPVRQRHHPPAQRTRTRRPTQEARPGKAPAATNSVDAGYQCAGRRQDQCARSRHQCSGCRRTNVANADKKSKEAPKPIEVVFVAGGRPREDGAGEDRHQRRQLLGDHRRATEGQEVVSGGYSAISRELEDGKKIRKGPATGEQGQGRSEKKE